MNEDIMRKMGFAREVLKTHLGICPICNHPVEDNFKDELSKREYKISGMCQTCQDKIFGAPDEDSAE